MFQDRSDMQLAWHEHIIGHIIFRNSAEQVAPPTGKTCFELDSKTTQPFGYKSFTFFKQMKYIKIILLLICLQPLTLLLAQQENQFTQYAFNQAIINPAYIGSTNYINLQFSKRHQWVGFPGAPESNALTIGFPFKYFNTALGVTAIQEKIGPLRNTILTMGYAYSVKVASKMRLSMGINAGINNYSANLDVLQTQDDKDLLLESGSVQRSAFTAGAGVFLYATNWYVGLSIPKIVTNSFSFGDDESDVYNLKERNHVYLIGGYILGVNNDKIKFKPSVCIKKVNNVKPSIDVSLTSALYNRIALGAGFRNPDTYFATLQVAVGKHLNVGYAYDISNSRISNFSNGTHEIVLDIRFYRDATKVHSPRFF